MAGSKINNYGVGDVDLTALMTTTDAQRLGYEGLTLTNLSNTIQPEIAAGSKIEVNGALFKFDSDEAITGSPSDGIVYIKLTPSGSSITASFTNTPPVWDDEKQGWYESATNNRYINWSVLKSGASWTNKKRLRLSELMPINPIGDIRPWISNTLPANYLLCAGQAVSRTTYSDLFGIVGTYYGVGDGSTTFNVPDFRGRMIIGLDNMGGASANRVTNAQADILGGVEGNENYQAHDHTIERGVLITPGASAGNFSINTVGAGTTTAGVVNSNGSGASGNMPPYIALNWIIRY